MAPSPLGSLPSKPSSSWLSSFTCRSFGGVVAQRCQKRALDSAVTSIDRFWDALQDVAVGLALPLDPGCLADA